MRCALTDPFSSQPPCRSITRRFAKDVNHFDRADNVGIQIFQPFRGNPPLRVVGRAHGFDGKLRHERLPHVKSRYESLTARLDVPVPGNLNGIRFVGDRVEDRLLG